MKNSACFVKLTSDESKVELLKFLADNDFTQLSGDDVSGNLLIDIYERTFRSVSNKRNCMSESEFYKRVNYSPDSRITRKRLFDDECNLLYEGNTFCDRPYGLGTLYFANGNKYQEAIFDVKGFVEGREYYPTGQLRFEGKYVICTGYGPNYPSFGRIYDEDGNLQFNGLFSVQRTGIGYPRIKNPEGYRIFQKDRPKYKWLMWNEKEMLERQAGDF